MNKLSEHIADEPAFLKMVRNLSGSFDNAFILESPGRQGVTPGYSRRFPLIAGLGSLKNIRSSKVNWDETDHFINEAKAAGQWIFLFLGYDLKNQIEKLESVNPDITGFPDMFLSVPEFTLIYDGEQAHLYSVDPLEGPITGFISNLSIQEKKTFEAGPVKSLITREEYINAVEKLKWHIQRGDIYEVNYCQAFISEPFIASPVTIYEKMLYNSGNPFSCFVKLDRDYLMCMSPERFISRSGNRILSQPIKGTLGRSEDPVEDDRLRIELHNSAKDRSENVMIVDLVRNDLSRIAAKGSVFVDELFGIYSFPGVHHLISSVSCELREDVGFSDLIRATFPMGSMTGAPKISAMKLIDEYEVFRRGLFSGSVGYIDPNGDFDLNVVIRSVFYRDQLSQAIMISGGAITAGSDPELEYEESLLKLKPLFSTLETGVRLEDDRYA